MENPFKEIHHRDNKILQEVKKAKGLQPQSSQRSQSVKTFWQEEFFAIIIQFSVFSVTSVAKIFRDFILRTGWA